MDVERDLNAADGAVIGELNFDRNVEACVVVRVDVVGDGGGKRIRGVQEKIDLGEMLK